MRTEEVTDTLDLALQASSSDQVHVVHKPRLLSPSRRYCISTSRAVERWHQTLKNRILLENYFLLGDLEAQIRRYVTLHILGEKWMGTLNTLTNAEVHSAKIAAWRSGLR